MKNLMMRINCVLAVATFVSLVGLGLASSVAAFNPQPEPPGSMLVGINFTQVARLSVLQPPTPILPGDPSQPPTPIRVRLTLFDLEGHALLSEEVGVLPGQGAFIDFEDSQIPQQRLQVYAIAQCLGDPAEQERCSETVKASMELYDPQSGQTNLVLPVDLTVDDSKK